MPQDVGKHLNHTVTDTEFQQRRLVGEFSHIRHQMRSPKELCQ